MSDKDWTDRWKGIEPYGISICDGGNDFVITNDSSREDDPSPSPDHKQLKTTIINNQPDSPIAALSLNAVYDAKHPAHSPSIILSLIERESVDGKPTSLEEVLQKIGLGVIGLGVKDRSQYVLSGNYQDIDHIECLDDNGVHAHELQQINDMGQSARGSVRKIVDDLGRADLITNRARDLAQAFIGQISPEFLGTGPTQQKILLRQFGASQGQGGGARSPGGSPG